MRTPPTNLFRRLAGLAALVVLVAPAAAEGPASMRPQEYEGVGMIDRRGESVPLDLAFVDEQGRDVTLQEYFKAGRPVLLTLNYYKCPQLCDLTLNGLIDGLNELEWSAGEEFELVTVSFNPRETPKLAEVKKRAYLTQYKRESAATGWHFLTGEEPAIRRLTDAVGFGYRYDEKSGEYAHPSTLVFLTPEGTVSVYMDDVVFEPKVLRLALVEASQGAIGSALDEFALFFCFQYDPESNSYRVVAWKLMRSGGMLTFLLLVSGLSFLWYRDLRERQIARRLTLDATP